MKSYKSIRKTIRFTDDEFSTIKEKMDLGNYSNFTEFALHSMINKKPSKAKSINKEYLLELNRIGNNLNQLTRKLNKGDRLNNLGLSAIIDIRDSINSLKEKI
ncbi:plasmid mobilization relaxosome protein MobC [Campylobacter ureolyticus]|uniref:plasmid mobilization protein n=1 Tax=Campylobacter ureolyticus TaxID=827 RepID=UPI0022B5D553|nr:plasmid mobilization relaxosome protein MobC [Campylobacter ureolyticus]MCZ6156986.1 plasmid mobilization relaxosome protein MobC [Campylobacter ureolyticus]